MDVKRSLIKIGGCHMGSSTILKMIIQICLFNQKQHCLQGLLVRIHWLFLKYIVIFDVVKIIIALGNLCYVEVLKCGKLLFHLDVRFINNTK
jgi:hypothetical protein